MELNDSLGFKINKVANILNSKFNHILQDYGIAIEQRAALEIIDTQKEVTLTMISNILLKDKTTMSRTLATLEKKAYIKRVTCKEDRRVTFLELTKKGRETLVNTKALIDEYRNFIIKDFTKDELKQLFRLLDKVKI